MIEKKTSSLNFFSPQLFSLLTAPENDSYRSYAYMCPSNKLTIGYGHVLTQFDGRMFGIPSSQMKTIIQESENKGKPSSDALKLFLSQENAVKLLRKDVQVRAEAVLKHVKVDLTQGQFDALVDFVFNVGEANFAKSTLLKKLNSGDYAGASDEFCRWVYGTSKGRKVKLPGLVNRRAAERDLFLKDYKA